MTLTAFIKTPLRTTSFKVEENYPLSPLTTFNVGGTARYHACVRSEEDLLSALDFAKSRAIPILALGGGSNILVSDDGFDGLVISNRIEGITSWLESGTCCVHAGSGEDWQEFVDWCASEKLQGVECLAGIPGTVGAAPVQNIGAYGQEVSETIAEVRAIEVDTGKCVLLNDKDCGFGYRTSIFNSTPDCKYFITGVTFRLKRNGKPVIEHKDLANHLEGASNCTILQVRDSVIDIRARKGLLVRKGYECFRCAGSFFKNPVLPVERSKEIEERAKEVGACALQSWPLDSNEVKISAASLIQSAGFGQGYRKGNVGLSPKHTLIIIAYNRATAQEIVRFAEEVRGQVKEKFGVLLAPEVRLVGFPPSCLA